MRALAAAMAGCCLIWFGPLGYAQTTTPIKVFEQEDQPIGEYDPATVSSRASCASADIVRDKSQLTIDQLPEGSSIVFYRLEERLKKKERLESLQLSDTRLARCRLKPADADGRMTVQLNEINCTDGGGLAGGGVITYMPSNGQEGVLLCVRDTRGSVIGSDVGIALNLLDRENDEVSSRYFGGASLYGSFMNVYSNRLRMIVNLASLDFIEDVDFETGMGLGLLFRPFGDNPDAGAFTVSLVQGYNLMSRSKEDPWYTMIGFGWSFGRENQSEE